jgi:hypothetical protein
MSLASTPAQCAWKIDDHVSLFIDEVSPEQFRVSMEHRTVESRLDGIVSTIMTKAQLRAYTKLLLSFLQD